MLCYAKSLQSCPTLWPHRRQPTRLPHPWDSPGKNPAVGCHFLLQRMKVKRESEVAQLCPTQWPHGLQPTRLLHPWDFPGKCTGVGCHCLLRTGYTPMQNKKLKKINEKEKRKGWIFICDLVKFWEYSVCTKKKPNTYSPFGGCKDVCGYITYII